MVRFRKDLEGFSSYKINKIAKHNLGDNENRLLDWSDLLAEAVQTITPSDLSYYGDNKYTELIQSFAKYLGVTSSQVVQGVGSDQMIQTVVSTFLTSADRLLTVDPDFFMYSVFSQVHGVQIDSYALEWIEGHPSLSAKKLLAYAKKKGVSMLILSNPNNPTSVAFDTSELEKIIQGFEGIVVVDEAYIDYADVPSLVSKVADYNNLIVLRTLSKAFGLAGLRLGFAVCCEKLAYELDKVLAPYSMPNIVARIGTVALNHAEKVSASVKETKALRQDFLTFLKQQPDVHVLESQANFVSFTAPYANDIYQAALAADFNFKYYKEGAMKNYIRMGIGRNDEMELMKEIIVSVVQNK